MIEDFICQNAGGTGFSTGSSTCSVLDDGCMEDIFGYSYK